MIIIFGAGKADPDDDDDDGDMREKQKKSDWRYVLPFICVLMCGEKYFQHSTVRKICVGGENSWCHGRRRHHRREVDDWNRFQA